MESSRRYILWEILQSKNLNLACADDPQALTHIIQASSLIASSGMSSVILLHHQIPFSSMSSVFPFLWLLLFSLELWLSHFHQHTHTHTHLSILCIPLAITYWFFLSLSCYLAKIHEGVLCYHSAQFLTFFSLLVSTMHSLIHWHSFSKLCFSICQALCEVLWI